MTEQSRNQESVQPNPNQTLSTASQGGFAANGQPIPHPVQAPRSLKVRYVDLENGLSNQRTVRGGVSHVLSGIQSRLEEIANDKGKDADNVRADVAELARELESKSEGWSGKILEGTTAANEPDPNAAQPVKPQLNV